MLNEKQEYRLYLTPDYGQLIRRKTVGDGLSGCRAVLTVLARGFFDRCRENGIDDLDRLHRYGTTFLQVWMAGQDALLADAQAAACAEELRQYDALYAELQRAQESNLLDHINRQDIPLKFHGEPPLKTPAERRRKILGKLHTWSRSMFYSLDKDSQNQIYFKVIIADALHEGALTDSALHLRRVDSTFGLEGDIGRSDLLECALAVVGVYLQKKSPQQTGVLITTAQLANYLNKAPNSKGRDSKAICVSGLIDGGRLSYRGEPLFTKQAVTGGSYKLTVNPRWLRDMDVRLAAADAPTPADCVRLTDATLFPDRFR